MSHTQDIMNDWAKIGTMLIVSHLISGGDVMDQNWQKASLFTLLGFTAYHLITRDMVDTGKFAGYKPIADDWVQVGTMMIVSRLLAGGDVTDQAWMKGSLFTLVGFSAYHLVTKNFIKGKELSGNPDVATTVNDWAKFGTMFIVSQLLKGGEFNQDFAKSSMAVLLGFATFNLAVKKFI